MGVCHLGRFSWSLCELRGMGRFDFIFSRIFADFIRLTSGSSLLEERQASRNFQDVCIKLTEAVNNIVSWQLESTTWLKRTLVVRQDTAQKASDISPSMEIKTLPGSLANSEVNSIKGSTTSLITQNTR